MSGLLAIVRPVSASLADCQLSFVARERIDVERARAQHAGYEAALRALGCRLLHAPLRDAWPDAVFVEDTAVVVDELAVITCPGAPSRRAEVDDIAALLQPQRPLARLSETATLDGGDVLRLGRAVYVGQGDRSNAEGLAALRTHLQPLGYRVSGVATRDCLHLKSAVTALDAGTVLIQRDWLADASAFDGYRQVAIDPDEPHAANVVSVAGRILMPAGFPRTQRRIEAAGFEVMTVDLSELQKAEGATTCCSVLLHEQPRPAPTLKSLPRERTSS